MNMLKLELFRIFSADSNESIVNLQWKFFDEEADPTRQRYFAVVTAGLQQYCYGVTEANSHLEAREAVLEAQARHKFPSGRLVTVVGFCRQPHCTCCNTRWELRSEHLQSKTSWYHSERSVDRIGDPVPDQAAVLARDDARGHLPLWFWGVEEG
jgi:hypothetical protein